MRHADDKVWWQEDPDPWVEYLFFWLDWHGFHDGYKQSWPDCQDVAWNGQLLNLTGPNGYNDTFRVQIWIVDFQRYFDQLDLDVRHSIALERQNQLNLYRICLTAITAGQCWSGYAEIGWVSLRSLSTKQFRATQQSSAEYRLWYLTDRFWYETLEYSCDSNSSAKAIGDCACTT
jgi:hypothetical protein